MRLTKQGSPSETKFRQAKPVPPTRMFYVVRMNVARPRERVDGSPQVVLLSLRVKGTDITWPRLKRKRLRSVYSSVGFVMAMWGGVQPIRDSSL